MEFVICVYMCVCVAGNGTQGLELARQTLYHLAAAQPVTTLCAISPLNLCDYYGQFADEEAEALREPMACLKSQSWDLGLGCLTREFRVVTLAPRPLGI